MLAGFDGAAWVLALPAATWLRYELDLSQVDGAGLARLIPLAVAAQWLVGGAARMYSDRYCVGSLDESVHLAAVVLLAGALVLGVDLVAAEPFVPRSVPLTAALLVLLVCWTTRMAWRRYQERRTAPDRASAQRVIIFGADAGGQRLARAMLSEPAGGYLPVAFLDDDPARRKLRVQGVAVCGTGGDVGAVAARTGATLVVVAVPEAGALHRLCLAAGEAGVGVKVMPPLSELFRPRLELSGLRDLDPVDLLGRRPRDTGTDMVGGYLRGKRVLVTGAGGSIGSELCRQIHRLGPAALFMLDRDDSALHGVRLSIYGSAPGDSPDVVLADIRDADAVRHAFARCRPEVVFHAAALKHLPMLEQYPLEGWKTNVFGTLVVLDAARAAGVTTFVNVSTDKAANPTSTLGRSKRMGERLVAHAATQVDGTYISVRFGNVLGSRGSMLTTFVEQLSRGVPVTVTHPEATRFFMTIPEAVQLVIHAGAIGDSGETLVLDMGTPIRIADVARHLAKLAGRSHQIVYTGLRAGEKLHEELFGHGERAGSPRHPAISHIRVPPLDPARMSTLAALKGELEAMAECALEDQPRPAAPAVPPAVPLAVPPMPPVPQPAAAQGTAL